MRLPIARGHRQQGREIVNIVREFGNGLMPRVPHAITTEMTLGVAPFSASQNWSSFTTSMLSS